MIDVRNGYNVGEALIVEDGNGEEKSITFGTSAPWEEPVLNAPIGSIHIRADGETYVKSGAGNTITDWGGQISNVLVAGGTGKVAFQFRNGDQDPIDLIGGKLPFTFRDGTPDAIDILVS